MPNANIHPTAIVNPEARIDPTATIGPYCMIERDVEIGAGTTFKSHVCVYDGVKIGANCTFHAFVAIGDLPQDLAHKNQPSFVKIGDNCTFREGSTVHRGTEPGTTTVIGNKCYLMGQAHVGHNTVVGDNVMMAHGALIGGRATIGNNVFKGGLSGVHQFCRIGQFVMLAATHPQVMDVPPYMMCGSDGVTGINTVGLRRAGIDADARLELKEAHKLLYRSGKGFRAAVDELATRVKTQPGRELVEFLQAPSKRGIDGYRARRKA
ncbi:MAG: acyl-ACP--UDP-N-acetylglucosamine O-acyltransferase [Phycisphaerae bacterium]